MNDMLEREVWPIFAGISGGLLISMLALTWAVSFVDERWYGCLVANGVCLVASMICTAATATHGATYTTKPRGWRKLRREAERRAYIEQLERELL